MLDEEKQSLEYWELKNVKDTYFNDGVKSVAKSLKSQGYNLEMIMNSTGLTASEIEAL
jgi:hypothetical protein